MAKRKSVQEADQEIGKFQLDVPVEFGGFSCGDETARLSLSISRDRMTPSRADQFLCGSRCSIRIAADPNADDDVPGQQTIDGLSFIESVVDIKSYRVNSSRIGCGLTFSIEEIDVADLAALANHKGRLLLNRVGDAGDTDDDGDDEEQQGRLADVA